MQNCAACPVSCTTLWMLATAVVTCTNHTKNANGANKSITAAAWLPRSQAMLSSSCFGTRVLLPALMRELKKACLLRCLEHIS